MMVTLEEAKEIAGAWLKDICRCTEYSNDYVFANPWSDNTIGGFDSPVAVLKENGKRMSITAFITEVGPGEEIETIYYNTKEGF